MRDLILVCLVLFNFLFLWSLWNLASAVKQLLQLEIDKKSEEIRRKLRHL